MSEFSGATLMITGGTGSFGNTVLKHFLDTDIREIRIFSRDEKKQDDMRHLLQATHPDTAGKVKFYVGDVRDPQSIRDAMPGVDYVFHAAALKQVPSPFGHPPHKCGGQGCGENLPDKFQFIVSFFLSAIYSTEI